MPEMLDWSLVRAFLAVAETGSLSAAARLLGASQPTLGRQIRQIEEQLAMTLFRRHQKGLELTEKGRALMPPALRMRAAMGEIALFAAGQEADLAGTVRITASEMVAHHLLPLIVAQIRQDLPEVAVELVPTDSSENLLYREADIAVRMYRPTQLDVVAQHLGDLRLGVFAAHRYLDRNGTPDTVKDLLNHDLVGYDRSDLIVQGMRAAGLDVTRESFATRCDDQIVYWQLVRAGCGVGFGQGAIARDDPDVAEIDLGLPIPPLPVWLVAHQGVRHTPRIRRVWAMLHDGLRPHLT